MDAALPNFEVREAASNMTVGDNESSSMVLAKDVTESSKISPPHQKEESQDDSGAVKQNQTKNCADELQPPSIPKSKDFEETSNRIDSSTASSESIDKERSIVQNDLSAKVLDNSTTDITLKSTKTIQIPLPETQCVSTESEPATACVDTQTPTTETQCVNTETEVRSMQYLEDKKARLLAEIAAIMIEIHALDPDKEKIASESKECQELACNLLKSILKKEIILLLENNRELRKSFKGVRAEIEVCRTKIRNFSTETLEEQYTALTRENSLLKNKCDTLEMDLKECKTKLFISYSRMRKLRKQMTESEDALPCNIKTQPTKPRAKKPHVSISLRKDEKLHETKNARKLAKSEQGSFSEEEAKNKALYEKRPSNKNGRSKKWKAAKPNMSLPLLEHEKLDGTENAGKSTEPVQRSVSEQQGKTIARHDKPSANEKSQSRRSKIGKPKVSFSLPEDVKLCETENACKPTGLVPGCLNRAQEQVKTEALYEKIHNILNVFTPEKTDIFVNQIRELVIDTPERLQGVIDLVFKKAADKPFYAIACALICKELSTEVVGDADDSSSAHFQKLFLTRCQTEFEKNFTVNEDTSNEKLREIDECTDLEIKNELQMNFELEKNRIYLRSVCNTIFIGELFKQNMLTCDFIRQVIRHFLTRADEMNLECLCSLLLSIGNILEAKEVDLSDYLKQMQQIANDKNLTIRCMIQDVIDLRMNEWISLSYDSNPKIMDEGQKKEESE